MAEQKIQKVVSRKSADLLSDQLRKMILRGDYLSGEMLPPERDLVAETGISRGSVREALRVLQTEGLVEITLGRTGGARVTTPKRATLARSVELFVRTNGVALSALLDCRAAVEPMLARLAAINRTEEELASMEELNKSFSEARYELVKYRRLNYRWHLAIAQASRNEPLAALMEAILTIGLEATAYETVTTYENRLTAIAAHERVMEMLRSGDGDAAASAMEAHLTDYSRIVKRSE
jgi:DNA-binding FadR family transcriptional regulator